MNVSITVNDGSASDTKIVTIGETEQAILDAERFYYHNIRPHMSINGMTPGQIAGLPTVAVEDNPWLTYIKKALKENNQS